MEGTKVEHTSGPWKVTESDRNGQAIVRAQHYEIATCWHHSVKSIEREMEANARLIAAAPEMLEALEDALSDRIGWPERIEKVIRKARGDV